MMKAHLYVFKKGTITITQTTIRKILWVSRKEIWEKFEFKNAQNAHNMQNHKESDVLFETFNEINL